VGVNYHNKTYDVIIYGIDKSNNYEINPAPKKHMRLFVVKFTTNSMFIKLHIHYTGTIQVQCSFQYITIQIAQLHRK